MSFEFDPFAGGLPTLPEVDKIERQDDSGSARDGSQIPVRIDHDLCDDTGVCSQVCPEDVIESRNGHSTVVKPEACTECWICVENCVSGAIDIG
jgi:MinD superfamily P-loop ATPase